MSSESAQKKQTPNQYTQDSITANEWWYIIHMNDANGSPPHATKCRLQLGCFSSWLKLHNRKDSKLPAAETKLIPRNVLHFHFLGAVLLDYLFWNFLYVINFYFEKENETSNLSTYTRRLRKNPLIPLFFVFFHFAWHNGWQLNDLYNCVFCWWVQHSSCLLLPLLKGGFSWLLLH